MAVIFWLLNIEYVHFLISKTVLFDSLLPLNFGLVAVNGQGSQSWVYCM